MTTTTKFTPRPLKRVARCVSTATLEFYIPREESGPSEERLALRRLLQYGCTRCLTPAQQQLTRLRYTDGLTVTAIAEQMGLAPSSVSRTSRPTTSARPLRARLPSALVTLGLATPMRSAMSTLRHDPRRRRITRMASR